VQDTTAPVLAGQGTNQIIYCPTVPVFTAPAATDNCDSDSTISFTDETIPGLNAANYAVTRTWVATDHCGNVSAAVSQTITVKDITAPEFTCPTNMILEFTGQTGTVVRFTTTATESCDTNVTGTCVPDSGSTFPIGTNTVHCTATDASGNSAACDFTITVLGARGVMQRLLDDLNARPAGARQKSRPSIEPVLRHVTKSVVPDPWLDENHLKAAPSARFFRELHLALQSLRQLATRNDPALPAAVLEDDTDRLVRVERLLAAQALFDATRLGASRSKVLASTRQLERGDAELAGGNVSKAVARYRLAWSIAVHAALYQTPVETLQQ
jgi:hypothetical protein